ncbi:MAG: methyltransferase domain-containing protein [Chloroflexia bacterium]|nr:methyltransferase domain-containing protein [Chloroflexia bacterium]
MVTPALLGLLRCPSCGSHQLDNQTNAVVCRVCHVQYPIHPGYIDLMPRGVDFAYVSKYVSQEEQLSEELDYRDLAPPVLAAGVRNRTTVRMLNLNKDDVCLDNGCGNGRFAVWNAKLVKTMVGNDPATMFADAAITDIELTQADSRVLPFADNVFDKAFSLDVLEHFPIDVIDAYLLEQARVLKPGGQFLAMSNTKEKSSLQPLVDISRWIGRQFVKAGVYDFEREKLRKSDHIKALENWDDVLAAFRRAGLKPVKVVFWNSVFTSFVEHVVMKLGEAWAGRAKPGDANAKSAAISDGTDREIRARRRLRKQLTRTSPVYWVIQFITWMMELDLWLFGSLHSGSYFIVVEKPRV